jgi:N-acetylglucosaminyldiphosphoundecaprenol N-acetyl-beta-D-mannosaminyltransferase
MRVTLLGLPVDILSFDETVQRIIRDIIAGRRCQHVALNVAKLINARTDADLDNDIRASDIIGIDGMGIVYALRVLGHHVPERVAGVDLFESLMGECEARGFRPFLLGATPEVLALAEKSLLQRYPNLVFAGRHHGYFTPEWDAVVCDLIRGSDAHCLFIAMPTPRKERFMQRYRDSLNVPFVMGVGGTLDVVAGHVHRAPKVLQHTGLEWTYRMIQEPRRLAGRYLRTNLIFAGLLLRHFLLKLAAGAFRLSVKAE